MDLLQDHGLPPPPEADWLDELNPYAVEAPYGMVDPDGLDRARAVLAAVRVHEWAVLQTRQCLKT
jgi:hypothetical protein